MKITFGQAQVQPASSDQLSERFCVIVAPMLMSPEEEDEKWQWRSWRYAGTTSELDIPLKNWNQLVVDVEAIAPLFFATWSDVWQGTWKGGPTVAIYPWRNQINDIRFESSLVKYDQPRRAIIWWAYWAEKAIETYGPLAGVMLHL